MAFSTAHISVIHDALVKRVMISNYRKKLDCRGAVVGVQLNNLKMRQAYSSLLCNGRGQVFHVVVSNTARRFGVSSQIVQ